MRHASWIGMAMALALTGGCSSQPDAGTAVALTQPTRTIRLPVQYVEAGESVKAAEARLSYSAGAEEEMPQGPPAFDVGAGNVLVVSDPLGERLAYYRADGSFLRAQPLGFAPELVSAEGQGAVRRYTDGTWVSPGTGQPVADPRPALPSGRLTGPNRAFLAAPSGLEADGLALGWGGPLDLASAQPLERDASGTWYIALEVMDQELDTVRKIVRKYGRGGNLLAEIRDIASDYYYAPSVEFQVRGGVVYQLEPLDGEVRIHAWDLNPF